jgi:hypothetical protein
MVLGACAGSGMCAAACILCSADLLQFSALWRNQSLGMLTKEVELVERPRGCDTFLMRLQGFFLFACVVYWSLCEAYVRYHSMYWGEWVLLWRTALLAALACPYGSACTYS